METMAHAPQQGSPMLETSFDAPNADASSLSVELCDSSDDAVRVMAQRAVEDSLVFSASGLESLHQKIDPDQLFFSEPLSEDEAWAIIDLYARTIMGGRYNASPEVIRRVERMILHLQGVSNRGIANMLDEKYQTVLTDYGRASRLIADRLSELSQQNTVPLLEPPKIPAAKIEAAKVVAPEPDSSTEPTIEPSKFSPRHVELFRQEINKVADRELLEGPLDEDEILGVIELYGRKYRSQAIIGRLAERLTALLEGATIIEVATRAGVDESSVRAMKRCSAKTIAYELQSIMPEGPTRQVVKTTKTTKNATPLAANVTEKPTIRQEKITVSQRVISETTAVEFEPEVSRKIIESLLESSSLPEKHKRSLRYHLGLNAELLPDDTTQRRNDACEKVRELIKNAKIRDRNKYGIKIENLPSPVQLQVVGRMLGSRETAIDPVPRNVLVHRYEIEIRKRYQDEAVDEDVLQQKIAQHGHMIDQAVAQTLQWAVSPRYRYETNNLEEESA